MKFKLDWLVSEIYPELLPDPLCEDRLHAGPAAALQPVLREREASVVPVRQPRPDKGVPPLQ